jgi:membrane-bound lytic murein transglycosylase MltF
MQTLRLAAVPWLLLTSCFASTQHARAEADQVPVLQQAMRSRLTIHVHQRTGEQIATHHCRNAAEGCDHRLAEFARYLSEAGEQYALDPWLLAAMAYRESGLNPFAVGTRGEKGILQLHPKNRRSKDIRFVQDARYWERCQHQAGACQREVVERAALILASSLHKCDGDLSRALGMYNTGRCGGSPSYARRVLKERARLMQLAGFEPNAWAATSTQSLTASVSPPAVPEPTAQ